MKSTKKRKPWTRMNADELADATKEFERPIRFEDTRPMSPENRRRWERSTRPKPIRTLIDPKLLAEAEAYAKQKKLSLQQILERGLRRELAVKD